jgi:hypothetical protein
MGTDVTGCLSLLYPGRVKILTQAEIKCAWFYILMAKNMTVTASEMLLLLMWHVVINVFSYLLPPSSG